MAVAIPSPGPAFYAPPPGVINDERVQMSFPDWKAQTQFYAAEKAAGRMKWSKGVFQQTADAARTFMGAASGAYEYVKKDFQNMQKHTAERAKQFDAQASTFISLMRKAAGWVLRNWHPEKPTTTLALVDEKLKVMGEMIGWTAAGTIATLAIELLLIAGPLLISGSRWPGTFQVPSYGEGDYVRMIAAPRAWDIARSAYALIVTQRSPGLGLQMLKAAWRQMPTHVFRQLMYKLGWAIIHLWKSARYGALSKMYDLSHRALRGYIGQQFFVVRGDSYRNWMGLPPPGSSGGGGGGGGGTRGRYYGGYKYLSRKKKRVKKRYKRRTD